MSHKNFVVMIAAINCVLKKMLYHMYKFYTLEIDI